MGSCRGDCNGANCEGCNQYLCRYRDCDRGYFSGGWAGDKWLCYTCKENHKKLMEIKALLLEHMPEDKAISIMHKIENLN